MTRRLSLPHAALLPQFAFYPGPMSPSTAEPDARRTAEAGATERAASPPARPQLHRSESLEFPGSTGGCGQSHSGYGAYLMEGI